MAPRTTRRKIRDQGQAIIRNFDSILDHLQYLDELADCQSDYINDKLPQLFLMIEGCKTVTETFTNGL